MTITQQSSTLEIAAAGNITVPSCQLMVFQQAVHFTSSGNPVSAVSIGGNALTVPSGGQIACNVGGTEEAGAVVAYRFSPPTGTQNLAWTAGGTAALGPVTFVTFWSGSTSALEFVDADTVQEIDFGGEALQRVLTTTTGDLVLGMCGAWLGVPVLDGATNLGENQVNSYDGSCEQWTAGSGTTTLNVASGNVLKAFCCASFRETAGGGGGSPFGPRRPLMGVGRRELARSERGGRVYSLPAPAWQRREGEQLYTRRAA